MVSPPTNKQILEWGLSTCVDGACLAVKIYVGHVEALVRQRVGMIFVPQIVSVSNREYTCPNFLGLPDLLKQYVPGSTRLLSPVIDARKSQRALDHAYLHLGLEFASRPMVNRAWREALESQNAFECFQHQELILPENRLKILLLGPRYLVDDPFLNGNIRGHLEGLGAIVYTATQVPDNASLELVKGVRKQIFWYGARRSMGALEYFVDRVDGVVNIAPFGCGADSLIGTLIKKRALCNNIAVLDLTMDEHTSEVGMVTRLEAFHDLLERKKSG